MSAHVYLFIIALINDVNCAIIISTLSKKNLCYLCSVAEYTRDIKFIQQQSFPNFIHTETDTCLAKQNIIHCKTLLSFTVSISVTKWFHCCYILNTPVTCKRRYLHLDISILHPNSHACFALWKNPCMIPFVCVGVMYSCEYDVCDVTLSLHPHRASWKVSVPDQWPQTQWKSNLWPLGYVTSVLATYWATRSSRFELV